jgi:hypothetical protein
VSPHAQGITFKTVVSLSLDAEASINPTTTILQLTNFATKEHLFLAKQPRGTSFRDISKKIRPGGGPNRISHLEKRSLT